MSNVDITERSIDVWSMIHL